MYSARLLAPALRTVRRALASLMRTCPRVAYGPPGLRWSVFTADTRNRGIGQGVRPVLRRTRLRRYSRSTMAMRSPGLTGSSVRRTMTSVRPSPPPRPPDARLSGPARPFPQQPRGATDCAPGSRHGPSVACRAPGPSVSGRAAPSGPGSHNRNTLERPAFARLSAVMVALHLPVPPVGPGPAQPGSRSELPPPARKGDP